MSAVDDRVDAAMTEPMTAERIAPDMYRVATLSGAYTVEAHILQGKFYQNVRRRLQPQVNRREHMAEPKSTCFQDWGDCMEDCGRREGSVRRSLCGMDCNVDLLKCLKDIIIEPDQGEVIFRSTRQNVAVVPETQPLSVTDIINGLKAIDEWDKMDDLRQLAEEEE